MDWLSTLQLQGRREEHSLRKRCRRRQRPTFQTSSPAWAWPSPWWSNTEMDSCWFSSTPTRGFVSKLSESPHLLGMRALCLRIVRVILWQVSAEPLMPACCCLVMILVPDKDASGNGKRTSEGKWVFFPCAKGQPNRADAWAASLHPRLTCPGSSSGTSVVVMETILGNSNRNRTNYVSDG